MEAQRELCRAQDDVIHFPHPRCEAAKKRALVEVFAMRIVVMTDQLQNIHGLILLKGSDQNYVIYEAPCDERGPQVDSEGQLILTGPECGVEVKDVIVIYPWLIDKCLRRCYRSKGNILWKRDACSPRIDQFIRSSVKVGKKLVQVDFAVYGDGVEAHLEVFISDLKFDEVFISDLKFDELLKLGNDIEVFGMIKASKSVLIHPEAKSVLFHHMTSRERIKFSNWPPGETEICVPLTRNVTVIPRESALIVDVCLWLSCTPENALIAVGSAVFDSRLGSNCTVEDQIIHGGHAKVKVRVTWSI